jgi:hypothetical protein
MKVRGEKEEEEDTGPSISTPLPQTLHGPSRVWFVAYRATISSPPPPVFV